MNQVLTLGQAVHVGVRHSERLFEGGLFAVVVVEVVVVAGVSILIWFPASVFCPSQKVSVQGAPVHLKRNSPTFLRISYNISNFLGSFLVLRKLLSF